MHPQLSAQVARQGGVFTTAQAIEAGFDAGQIRVRLRNGTWRRVRRGVLAERATYDRAADDPRSSHLLKVAAALVLTGYEPYVSHRSAAIVHRLPIVGTWPDRVALTFERQHRRRAVGLELHTARTPARHRTVAEGLPVTTVARTVSDLARSLPFASAVVAADHALHTESCTVHDVEEVISDCPVWPGIARTKRVLAFADRRSESPGESLSRVAIASAGLPEPELQVELLLGGQHVRVDFMWPARRLVGEFDGRVKYVGVDDLWTEKKREDLIRRHDYRVVRWVWSDVHPDPSRMVRRIDAALRAAG